MRATQQQQQQQRRQQQQQEARVSFAKGLKCFKP
jgi:hypothetical protein